MYLCKKLPPMRLTRRGGEDAIKQSIPSEDVREIYADFGESRIAFALVSLPMNVEALLRTFCRSLRY